MNIQTLQLFSCLCVRACVCVCVMSMSVLVFWGELEGTVLEEACTGKGKAQNR